MSLPENPSANDIVIEGLAKAGELDPDSSLITRVTDQWLREIKGDIYKKAKTLKCLQTTSYGVLNIGLDRYSNPSDFGHGLSVELLYGSKQGVATGGALGYVDLAADSDFGASNILGLGILIIGGTGQASYSQITGYNETTKRAAVTPNFQVAPSSGSTYMVIEQTYPVDEKNIGEFPAYRILSRGLPACFFPIGDEDYDEIQFNCPPDLAYGIRYRYYADIRSVDLASTTMTRILKELENIFLKGIEYRQLAGNNHARRGEAFQEYQLELNKLRFGDTYDSKLGGGQMRVVDYA